jgi:hypothetical protein
VTTAPCGTPVDGFPGDATALLSAAFSSTVNKIASNRTTPEPELCITSDAEPVGTVILGICEDDALQRWTFSSASGTISIPATERCLTFNGALEPVRSFP